MPPISHGLSGPRHLVRTASVTPTEPAEADPARGVLDRMKSLFAADDGEERSPSAAAPDPSKPAVVTAEGQAASTAGKSALTRASDFAEFKAAPVLGIVGSSVATAQGVRRLAQGSADGVSQTLGGGSGMLSQTALVTGATKLAGAAGGAGALFDGSNDLVQAVRTSDLEKGIAGTVKTTGGALMVAGAGSLNPVLVATGGAVYLTGVTYEHREAIYDTTVSAARWAYNKVF